jgi:hypothetical protein
MALANEIDAKHLTRRQALAHICVKKMATLKPAPAPRSKEADLKLPSEIPRKNLIHHTAISNRLRKSVDTKASTKASRRAGSGRH